MSGVEKGVVSAAENIAKAIGDPALIVLTIVIVGLLFILYMLTKSIEKKDKTHQRHIDSLTSEIHENSQTLVRLAILIEVLVHGRKQYTD
jgi:hypothetical protein